MYQRRLSLSIPLEKVCFRMQPSTVAYVRAAARASGLSQSAVLNAIILDFCIRQAEDGALEKSSALRHAKSYASALVSHIPKSSLSQLIAFCQDHVPPKL